MMTLDQLAKEWRLLPRMAQISTRERASGAINEPTIERNTRAHPLTVVLKDP